MPSSPWISKHVKQSIHKEQVYPLKLKVCYDCGGLRIVRAGEIVAELTCNCSERYQKMKTQFGEWGAYEF